MRINWQQLKNLPVETSRGLKIGHVIDYELDVDTWNLVKIIASSGILNPELRIATTQIISIDKDRLVVEDASEVVAATAEA
jgi:sporulation protein YlmC with PRC-barrel domain